MGSGNWGSFGWDVTNSDDEEDEGAGNFASKTALLAVIDASPNMFRPWGDNDDKPIIAALKCCYSMWRTKIVSTPKDKVGILFISTEHAKNSSDFPNLYMLQELSTVKKDMICNLHKMIENPTDMDGFEDKIGSSADYDMKDMFWLAKILLEEGDTKNMYKKIMLFTTEDNPHQGNQNLQQDAIRKFKDLGNVDFSIVTFNEQFDRQKFYSNIVEEESSVVFPKDIENLEKVVRIKQRLKRPITRGTLEIDPGIKIGVGVYSLVRRAWKPRPVKIHLRSNDPLNRTVNAFRDNGMPILKSEVIKAIKIGGEIATFTPTELKELKYHFEAGIVLIGFLDRSLLDPFTWYRSPGYLLYPDEDQVTGSKDFFTTLLRRCDALQKIALVRFVMTRGRNPKLGCLVPSMGNENSVGPNFPQGFHLVVLPFADEIRHHEVEEVEATPDMTNTMERIVKKLTQRNFNVADVKNPLLYYKWKEIESNALDLPLEEEDFFDSTQPNLEVIEERVGPLAKEFQLQLDATGKYTSSAVASSSQAKKPKLDFDMETEARNGRLNKLTNANLMTYMDEKKLSYQNRETKAKLIDKINAYFNI